MKSLHRCVAFAGSLLTLSTPAVAQNISSASRSTAHVTGTSSFERIPILVSRELSGEKAHSTVAYVEKFFRLPGNRGFDASIDTVASLLESAGFVRKASAKSSNRLVYRIDSIPMLNPAWTPDSASITIAGRKTPLLHWSTNRNMLAINSGSTVPGGVTAKVVDVGNGADSILSKLDVRGHIVLTSGAAGRVFPLAMKYGAVGVLALQRLPAYNQPQKNVQAIGFGSIPRDLDGNGWLIFLPPAAADSLRKAMASSSLLEVHVMTATKLEQRPERTIVAEVLGSEFPEERFVYSAHVQEPGANDNASGVGLLAEMARTAAELMKQRAINPSRTITFLWGDEIRSTRRYLAEDSLRRSGVRWGMSLDMVGENTALTGGTFLIEKMPDPSAVWVRGEDQHSEWGGRPLDKSAIRSHWFNDFVRQRCLARAAETGWVVKANPFEGGSDHTPFLNAGIPAVLLWHFTDQYYHTDMDRIEMVSKETLANVGNCALNTGLLLATGGSEIASSALEEITEVAIKALAYQSGLSVDTLGRGGSVETERAILETWRDFYIGALAKVTEIGDVTSQRIATAQQRVRAASELGIAALVQRRE